MTADHSNRVLPPIRQEVTALRQHYPNVRYEAGDRVVELDADLGGGWTPQVVTMQFRLPAQYPRAAPRIDLPWDLRCRGTVPRQLLSSGHWLVRGTLGDPIRYYPSWEQSDTLKTLADTVVAELTACCEPDEPRRRADA